jgi:catechol 2,3-dioxygenase
MEVKELGHIVLYVRNVERSAAFYRDVLGWRQIVGPGSSTPSATRAFPAAAFSAPSGRTHHELLLIEVGEHAAGLPQGRHIGLYHFGLKIGETDDDLRAALESLQRHEVKFVGASDHTVTHSLYILDPDGNEIELYVDVPDVDWRNDPTLFAAPVRPLSL